MVKFTFTFYGNVTTGDMLGRNVFLKHVSEGQIEETGKRKRRRKQQLPDDLKETRGHWKLREEALGSTFWRSSFGRSCGPVVRQTI
jgi:hypothetical protein